MSVRKGDRTQSNFEVLTLMRNLTAYTLKAVGNENLFPKKSRWLIASKIANECTEAYSNVMGANSIWVGDSVPDEDKKHSKVSKQRRKMRKLYAKELNGDVEPGTTKKSLDSWLANAEHGDTYKIREGMEKYYKELTENDRSIENGKSRSAVAGGAD